MVNYKEIEIISDGLKLYGKLYLTDKVKPTIILLHGLGFHSFEYDDFAPILAEAGYNCLSFDFRCCGKSEGKRGYWTLDDYIEDTKNIIEYVKQNINDSIILYGNSLGADAAISTATKYSNYNIKAIISANCATKISDFALTPFRKFLFTIAKLFEFIPFRISVDYFIPYTLIFEDKEKAKEVSTDKLVTDARKFTVSTYQDIFSWDMTKIMSKINIPILIIQGKKDRLQPISQANMLFDAANEPKELILIDTGHLPNIENPKYLSEIVIKWLSNKF